MNNQSNNQSTFLPKNERVTKVMHFFHCVHRRKINKNSQTQNQQFHKFTIKNI